MLGTLVRGAAVCSAAGVLVVAGGSAAFAIGPAPVVSPPTADGPTSPVIPLPLTLPDVRPADPAGHSEPGSAAATGVGVAPLDACVACTSAGSTPGAEHAGATAVRVLGLDVAGGKSTGDGPHSGALLAVPANPLLSLALGQWAADSRSHQGASSSKSALIAFVILPAGHDEGGTATICVIDTSSDSHDNGTKSTGSGELADAKVVGDTVAAQVGHSDASENGSGKAYVVGVNQNEVISSDQSTQGVPIQVPGADLVVVHKQAGDADTEAAVAAAEAQQAAPNLGSPVADAVLASAASPAQTGEGTAVNTPSTGSTPGLPATGGGVGAPSTGTALGLGGLLLLLPGAALTALSLRRRSAGG